MPLSRLARTHLVYQFLIIALVFLAVGYHELLLERRLATLVLIVPTFLYQLLVLGCCTELVPVPRWMNLTEASAGTSQENIGSLKEDDPSKQNNEVPAMSTELNNLNNGHRDFKVCARKYKIRNWKASSPENSLSQPPIELASPGKNDEECKNTHQILSPEPTKKYFFPYRQKRLEQWIDPKENSRPFKIRNWQSNINIDESSAMPSTSDTFDEPSPVKNLADSSSVPEKCSAMLPESELMMKRYTLPFRQKHSSIEPADDNELDNSDGNLLLPTPFWRTTAGYSLAVKQEARRRRRSVSSSLLTTSRQLDRGKYESEKSMEFSQSVEMSSNDSIRGTTSSPSGSSSMTFAKMKLGFVNCFTKIKRANSKNNLNKGFGNNKNKRSFKSMFQSRENVNLGSAEKDVRSKPKDEESNCDFYPSYIPFQKERFETDVRKRMSELPKN